MAEDQARQFIEQATQSLQGGQFNQALDLAEQAVAQSPDNPEAHLLRAIALSQSNQPQAATEAFGKAISLAPSSSKAYFNFAVHLYGLGQKAEALNAAQKASELDPAHAGARDLVGRIESESGLTASQTPSAEAEYPRAVEGIRPGYDQPAGHSIQWVEKMGPAWTGIAWLFALTSLLLLTYSVVVVFPVMFQHFGEKDPAVLQSALKDAMGPLAAVLSVLGWVEKLSGLAWLMIDLADRRGQWLWVVPQVLCGCAGFNFLILPLYILAGRRKIA